MSELEIAAAHCDAAALAFEKALVHANTSADEVEEARNRLNLAGVAGESVAHASQVQQALEDVQQRCMAGKQDAEAKAAAIRAMMQGG